MERNTTHLNGLALLAPEGTGRREAAELVRRTLAERGAEPWPVTEIELYPGSGGCLLIARPARGEKVYITTFALRALAGYGRGENFSA